MADGNGDAGGEVFCKKAVEVFRACCSVPVATGAYITPAASGGRRVEVQVTWTQKDIERGKKVASSKSYFVEKDSQEGLQVLCASNFQADATNV